MKHSEIPPEKIKAYLDTHYRFGQGVDLTTLRIDMHAETLLQLYASSGCACGVFITAYNPYGDKLSSKANEVAHAHLGEELKTLAQGRVIDGAGADPTGDWPEEKSFFVLGVDLDAARELGIRYKQDAIVWVGEDAVPKLILLR